jgi:L,D-peptidoglycan transpeptidase YkuD (ErfK/YbiS/YcfS/YnhG family)
MRPFLVNILITRSLRFGVATTLVMAWVVWALGGAPNAPLLPQIQGPAEPMQSGDEHWLPSIPMAEAQATPEVRTSNESARSHSLEQKMVLAYQAAYAGNATQAMAQLDQILSIEPAFRPALTLRGQLAAEWAKTNGAAVDASQALIEEARVRLEAQRLRHQRAHEVPANLVLISSSIHTVLAADIQEARLYVLKRNGDQFNLATDYYLSTGTAGAHKHIEGDQRTPVGIYSLKPRLKSSDLPALAGHGAWPLNFPNHWDKAQKRLGSGIWLHGTLPGQYDGLPHSTNGCLALSNEDLDDLAPSLSDPGTIVLIAEHLEWVNPQVLAQQRNQVLKRLSNDPIIYRGNEEASVYLYPAEQDVLLIRSREGTDQLKEHFWSGDGSTRLALDHS